MVPPVLSAPRLRNAAATRDAILASATRHFARESYEQVGLRELAGDAGVDPALVSRYFGGKEQLFKEVLRGKDQHMMAGITRDGLPAHLAALLIDEGGGCETTSAKIDRLLILLRSASSPKASQIVRDAMNEDILEPIAGVLDGADAPLRASLCMAIVMGCGILRSAMGLAPLCDVDETVLRRRLTALFAAALADDAPGG
jgi:AcrR family transcriptional regulator